MFSANNFKISQAYSAFWVYYFGLDQCMDMNLTCNHMYGYVYVHIHVYVYAITCLEEPTFSKTTKNFIKCMGYNCVKDFAFTYANI